MTGLYETEEEMYGIVCPVLCGIGKVNNCQGEKCPMFRELTDTTNIPNGPVGVKYTVKSAGYYCGMGGKP